MPQCRLDVLYCKGFSRGPPKDALGNEHDKFRLIEHDGVNRGRYSTSRVLGLPLVYRVDGVVLCTRL